MTSAPMESEGPVAVVAAPAPLAATRRMGRAAVVVAAALAAAVIVTLAMLVAGTFQAPAQPAPNVAAEGDQSLDAPVADPNEEAPISWERTTMTSDELLDQMGVQVVQVAATAGGGLLDVRYRVLDPDKAGSIHDDATPPGLVDERNSLVVDTLLMGHSHANDFVPGVTYYFVFENPGNLVERGDLVTVVLGDGQLEHVEVH